ncbi:MAG: AI-2E family transporter [Proteobacteria bacterium]|jgi:predicted PurR-regulated permease PerM|nr:AI-2E family transporter [Pseudomonadota bacterium]
MSRPADDWRDVFHLNVFLDLSLVDGVVERRDRVWIKRFLATRDMQHLYARMEEIIAAGRCAPEELHRLVVRAAAELSLAEKRHTVFDLAQLAKSKGSLRPEDYEKILDLAQKIGVPDTEADAMLHSVYRINDTFIAIMGLLACGTIIYLTRSVIIPLVIAIFITMIINRIDGAIASVFKLQRLRWFTKLGAMVIILGAVFGLVMAAIVSGTDIASRFPEYETRISTALRESVTAQSMISWLGDKGVLAQLQQLPFGSMARGLLSSMVNLLSNFVLVVIFTGFLVPSSSAFKGVMADMNKKIGAYISTKSLVCLLTGITVYALCTAFGVDFALFWALLAFLLNFIPVVGAIIASVPPILLSVVQLDSWTAIVFFALCMLLLNILIGQVLEPKLMGNRLALKPIAILLGLIFWGLLLGIPGMFLSTPLMVLLRILSSHFNFSRSFERLLSTDTN